MNTDDRTLLERAARAAGIEAQWDCPERGMMVLTPDGIDTMSWNPLTDDGDALRLAVKLNLRVDCYDNQVETLDGCEPFKIGRETFVNTFVKIEPTDGGKDRMAATRRAITRAAAQIGTRGERG